ncbi:hypothetical protein KM043_017920 [Ampulex compressa]|nr:hypothetical protein KM043_017920 [Ampulex compressa]
MLLLDAKFSHESHHHLTSCPYLHQCHSMSESKLPLNISRMPINALILLAFFLCLKLDVEYMSRLCSR